MDWLLARQHDSQQPSLAAFGRSLARRSCLRSARARGLWRLAGGAGGRIDLTANLSTFVRNTCQSPLAGTKVPAREMTTRTARTARRAYDLTATINTVNRNWNLKTAAMSLRRTTSALLAGWNFGLVGGTRRSADPVFLGPCCHASCTGGDGTEDQCDCSAEGGLR